MKISAKQILAVILGVLSLSQPLFAQSTLYSPYQGQRNPTFQEVHERMKSLERSAEVILEWEEKLRRANDEGMYETIRVGRSDFDELLLQQPDLIHKITDSYVDAVLGRNTVLLTGRDTDKKPNRFKKRPSEKLLDAALAAATLERAILSDAITIAYDIEANPNFRSKYLRDFADTVSNINELENKIESRELKITSGIIVGASLVGTAAVIYTGGLAGTLILEYGVVGEVIGLTVGALFSSTPAIFYSLNEYRKKVGLKDKLIPQIQKMVALRLGLAIRESEFNESFSVSLCKTGSIYHECSSR